MINKYISIFIIAICFIACEPQEDVKPELGPAPTASFSITEGASPNYFTLTNTSTPDVFLTTWDLGAAGTAEGESVEAYFQNMGEYDVVMTTFNRGGSATATQTITVTQNDALACLGNFEILTTCDEKTWVLAPEAGALHVGPNAVDVWWANSEDDVAARDCHFNDEYIFRADGEFEYKNNGDFWADTDGNGVIFPGDLGLDPGCQPSTAWPPAYSAWDSGVHNFSVSDTELTVIGEGAWIGLYKVGNGAEVATPQSTVSYEIQSLDESRMVLIADLNGVVWKFTLVAQ